MREWQTERDGRVRCGACLGDVDATSPLPPALTIAFSADGHDDQVIFSLKCSLKCGKVLQTA